MPNIHFSFPRMRAPHITIPQAWNIFTWVTILLLSMGLIHDAYVFYEYGAGWQRDLAIPEVKGQTFREEDLNEALSLLHARKQSLQELDETGVSIKNLFGAK